jgi:RsiW-degrading membrane proteinase PrsW (M82 family)
MNESLSVIVNITNTSVIGLAKNNPNFLYTLSWIITLTLVFGWICCVNMVGFGCLCAYLFSRSDRKRANETKGIRRKIKA